LKQQFKWKRIWQRICERMVIPSRWYIGDDSVEVPIEEDPPGTGEQHWKLLCMHSFKLSAANLPSEQR
jgi:hypothetical protein